MSVRLSGPWSGTLSGHGHAHVRFMIRPHPDHDSADHGQSVVIIAYFQDFITGYSYDMAIFAVHAHTLNPVEPSPRLFLKYSQSPNKDLD